MPIVIAALLAAVPAASSLPYRPCPAPLKQRLETLYRWQVSRQNAPGPTDLTPVAGLLSPSLHTMLESAYELTPSRDGRFVDFDVFSGTQVSTFGASVDGCRALSETAMQARVSVWVGLRGRASDTPQVLLFRMQTSPMPKSPVPTGTWLIDDITYPGQPTFHLRGFLTQLLRPSSGTR